jgi:hypothetical protein
VRNHTRFIQETGQVMFREPPMQYFYGSLCIQMNMLPQVHVGKISPPQ